MIGVTHSDSNILTSGSPLAPVSVVMWGNQLEAPKTPSYGAGQMLESVIGRPVWLGRGDSPKKGSVRSGL